MTNRWKVAFICLLTVVIIVGSVVILMLTLPVHRQLDYHPLANAGETVFTIHTTKERLNHFIEERLKALEIERENVDFTVVLDENVKVDGYVNVFQHRLHFQMHLTPRLLDNGDLLLEHESFYIGQMPIPRKQVLTFISEKARLPDWVMFDPSNEKIVVALNEIELHQGLRIKAKTIDLKNNDIVLEMYISNASK